MLDHACQSMSKWYLQRSNPEQSLTKARFISSAPGLKQWWPWDAMGHGMSTDPVYSFFPILLIQHPRHHSTLPTLPSKAGTWSRKARWHSSAKEWSLDIGPWRAVAIYGCPNFYFTDLNCLCPALIQVRLKGLQLRLRKTGVGLLATDRLTQSHTSQY
jgi:hypothetical protein